LKDWGKGKQLSVQHKRHTSVSYINYEKGTKCSQSGFS